MINRIIYIDILKGFSILAVVWFHINFKHHSGTLFSPSLFGSIWHVPIFFFVGGFFITESKINNTKSFLKNKIFNLYIKGLCYFIPVAILHNKFFAWGWYSTDIEYGGEHESVMSFSSHCILIVKQFLLMSREPIVGAMWFLDSLFIAMTCLGLLYWFCKRLRIKEVFPIAVLVLVVMSNFSTNLFGIVLPKINNSISGMGLIYLGSYMFQRGLCDYVNKYTFLISLMLLWNISLLDNQISLNKNAYNSVLQLIGITISAYYTYAFIAKKIERSYLGKAISFIGEYSFAIMGLHFVGFKICSMFLSFLTGNDVASYYLTTPDLGGNYFYIFSYYIFGIFIPIVIVRIISCILKYGNDKCLHCNL